MGLNCEVNCKEIAYMKAAGGEKNQHFVFWQSDFLLKSSLFATNFTKSPPFFSLKFSGIFSGFPKISGILKNRILGNSLKFLGKKRSGTISTSSRALPTNVTYRMDRNTRPTVSNALPRRREPQTLTVPVADLVIT